LTVFLACIVELRYGEELSSSKQHMLGISELVYNLCERVQV